MPFVQQVLKQVLAATLPQRLLLVRGGKGVGGGKGVRNRFSVAPGFSQDQSEFRKTVPDTFSVDISLTFDDGPHPEHTPRLLDALADAGIRATFFVIGERAQRYPPIVRRIVDEGHEVGNHTFTHGDPKRTSAAMFGEEIARTRRLLYDLTGVECSLVRPPKGKLTVAKAIAAWKQHQTLVLWTADTRDFAMKTRLEIERWVAAYSARCGDVVLMHDKCACAEFAVNAFANDSRFGNLRFVSISWWLRGPIEAVPASGLHQVAAQGSET